MNTTLAERITMRLVPPKTKAGLARACGIRQPSVSDWLNGRTKKITGANLLRAAVYLEVNPEWLATGQGPMRPGATSSQTATAQSATFSLPTGEIQSPLVVAAKRLDRARHIPDAVKQSVTDLIKALLAHKTPPTP